jgi:hypothetical protein
MRATRDHAVGPERSRFQNIENTEVLWGKVTYLPARTTSLFGKGIELTRPRQQDAVISIAEKLAVQFGKQDGPLIYMCAGQRL